MDRGGHHLLRRGVRQGGLPRGLHQGGQLPLVDQEQDVVEGSFAQLFFIFFPNMYLKYKVCAPGKWVCNFRIVVISRRIFFFSRR